MFAESYKQTTGRNHKRRAFSLYSCTRGGEARLPRSLTQHCSYHVAVQRGRGRCGTSRAKREKRRHDWSLLQLPVLVRTSTTRRLEFGHEVCDFLHFTTYVEIW